MRDLLELATLMQLVVQNPDDELAVQRLKNRLRKSDTVELTRATILLMLRSMIRQPPPRPTQH
jgi:hypothetical protein